MVNSIKYLMSYHKIKFLRKYEIFLLHEDGKSHEERSLNCRDQFIKKNAK